MVHFLYRGGRTESSFGTIPSNGSILIINYTAESGLFGARFPVFEAKKGAAAPADYLSTFAIAP